MKDQNKRYIVTVDMYVYARNDQHAISKAKMIAKRQCDQYDNQCEVVDIIERPFASLMSRQVPLK